MHLYLYARSIGFGVASADIVFINHSLNLAEGHGPMQLFHAIVLKSTCSTQHTNNIMLKDTCPTQQLELLSRRLISHQKGHPSCV
jgi:hypothetical protein